MVTLRNARAIVVCVGLVSFLLSGAVRAAEQSPLAEQLDAPLLFTKRLNYLGIHIYDTFYKWRPGGGIYVIENPSTPPEQQIVRPVIDPTTPGTLGEGMYTDPDISWDAKRVLFCFKGGAQDSTSIYEIGIDGKGLRRLTDPSSYCSIYKGSNGGQHDVSPAYLPDDNINGGRIVFTSTRFSGLVPCANEGADIMHVMNADGSDLHAISVNNVNEFDPCVMHDGRIIFGRWEYVDKTGLTQQSVWTIFPDGTNETAFFANNMVFPEAVLDVRPVPGTEDWVVGTFTPHNAPPRGSIAMIDPRRGKNDIQSIIALEHPENPAYYRGESCDPWPLSKEAVLYSGRPAGAQFNALMMIDRNGNRVVVRSEPDIDCHSPMLVKPRKRPPVLAPSRDREQEFGRFFVQDIYRGMDSIGRGEVKWLRVVEETSRVSPTPGGAYNQTFLLSAALAFSVKNFLGIVPVEPDGSAYFEVPSNRAVYLQALDQDMRLIRSMRTFVQAAPGVTRSCIGCHENKYVSSPAAQSPPMAFSREPDRLKPESWGTGFIDYPSMVQPIFDRHCVRCHGGEEGMAGKLDLSGGWTEHFNISYVNLISRRDNQHTATLIAGIDCMNGTAFHSAAILPPRSHGSATAPLAEVLASGHENWIAKLSRTERDLLMAWIDTNGLYYGSWDYTRHGCAIKNWAKIRQDLSTKMNEAGCMECHHRIEEDWVNLKRPEQSRILRAPLPKGRDGWGLNLCRSRKLHPNHQRVRILVNGGYAHAVLPLEAFNVPKVPAIEDEGQPVTPFASSADESYRAMLAIIQDGRREALSAPRVDMPGAEIEPGICRQFAPPRLPYPLPELHAVVDQHGIVQLRWERSARTIGLASEVHRGATPEFDVDINTLLATTEAFACSDAEVQPGQHHYAVVLVSQDDRSAPIRMSVQVPTVPAPSAPQALTGKPQVGSVELRWDEAGGALARYHVYRAEAGSVDFKRLSAEPTMRLTYTDVPPAEKVQYVYTVRAVNRRGVESESAAEVTAATLPEIKQPMFSAAFRENALAELHGGGTAQGTLYGQAKVADGTLDLRQGGHASFEHRPEFDLTGRISVECWVKLDKDAQCPVIVSCGHWHQAGWLLQKLGPVWRWYVAGIDCDGGQPELGRWYHLLATFDGQTARIYQDGQLVAEKAGPVVRTSWPGPLFVGQYCVTPSVGFQVTGQIRGLQVYSRAVKAEEAAEKSQTTLAAKQP